MRERVRAWREEWSRSSARAGSAGAMFARQRVDAFVRARWRRFVVIVVAVAVIAVALWLWLPTEPGARGFAVGVFLTGALGALYHWIVLASGAASSTMGQAAEEWTSSELRRLRRSGWKTLDHVVLRPPGDIDHVAIGPDGVIVIETKWRSLQTDLDAQSSWIESTARSALRSRKDVAGHLGWGAHDDARITALVVVWGPGVGQTTDGPLRAAGDVNLIAGEQLRTVLGDLGEAHLDDEEIDRVYRKLAKQMDRGDRWEAERHADDSPTVHDLANSWAQRLVAGSASFVVAILSLGLGWWSLGAFAALVGVGVAARGNPTLRLIAAPWLFGVGVAAALVGIVLVVAAA